MLQRARMHLQPAPSCLICFLARQLMLLASAVITACAQYHASSVPCRLIPCSQPFLTMDESSDSDVDIECEECIPESCSVRAKVRMPVHRFPPLEQLLNQRISHCCVCMADNLVHNVFQCPRCDRSFCFSQNIPGVRLQQPFRAVTHTPLIYHPMPSLLVSVLWVSLSASDLWLASDATLLLSGGHVGIRVCHGLAVNPRPRPCLARLFPLGPFQ